MAKIDWIDIAIKLAIAVLATTWGVYFKSLLEKWSSNSSETKTATKIGQSVKDRIGKVFSSLWFMPAILVSSGIFYLYRDLTRVAPTSKSMILNIAFDLNMLFFGIAARFFLSMVEILKATHSVSLRLTELVSEHIEASSGRR